LGTGLRLFIWTDPWLGEALLCVRFQRLFDLADNKLSTVAEMRGLGWGGLAVASSDVVMGGGSVSGV
jgi:hypothetical protein